MASAPIRSLCPRGKALLELTLRPKADRIPLFAEGVSPCRLAGQSSELIRKQTVFHGNQACQLGDFFEVKGDVSDGKVRVVGDCRSVKGLGSKMAAGEMSVDGDVGDHFGAGMSGGVLALSGNAGDWAGAEMAGGFLSIGGNAGDVAGGGYRGGARGMSGGTLLVHGDAGAEVGSKMRRGLIAVGGRSGDFAGVGMIAGTILLFGPGGIHAGAGMKRGAIVCFDPATVGEAPPTFRAGGRFEPAFLRIYIRRLQEWGFPVTQDFTATGFFERWRGDFLELGKGELLRWRPSPVASS
ncbi:MAG TPA: formylmethanofuran dehydrogenase subunit C [Planctomycetia bacterium]|nr:formylmethanofuran dehydrogenase subunit C [Planctomycetia bacterium]